jgi:Domain of unknown function (DUF4276)
VVTEIRIYFEGHEALRPGFNEFFSSLRSHARTRRCGFRVIPGGSGSTACRDFSIALRTHPNAWNILLKDSEGPDTGALSESLCREQGWDKANRDSIFWMVEMMESWFHADKDAIEGFYGRDFARNALRPNPKVEEIPKTDLESGLREATRHTSKGNYFDSKTSHGPKLLEVVSPDKVQQAAPNCKRLFDSILAKLA